VVEGTVEGVGSDVEAPGTTVSTSIGLLGAMVIGGADGGAMVEGGADLVGAMVSEIAGRETGATVIGIAA
jgi:hypothetical protein